MPPAAVPPVANVAQKWARRVQGATQDYSDGITRASGKWQPAATAGQANYVAGVQAAAGAGRYAKGVARAGDAKWQRKSRELGSQRYGPGASAAEGDFSTALGPVLEVIGRTDLPPRGPRGADANLARVGAIAKALRTFATTR